VRITWHISKRDVQLLTKFVQEHRDNPFVRHRIQKNLSKHHVQVRKERFWYAMILCLVTTQQRSGPDSLVSKFLAETPFPLRYSVCKTQRQLRSFAQRVLSKYHLRRSTKIAAEVDANWQIISSNDWLRVRSRLGSLKSRVTSKEEREVANFLAATFKGLGPKQSRNLLQHLGLTRYEIPLDSRITRWLNDFGFPFVLSPKALADPNFYEVVLDGVQLLCKKAGVYPCVLDAAIFSSYDDGKWDDSLVR